MKVTSSSSVIRQKGESRFIKTKHTKFSGKTTISYPLIRTRKCAYQGVKDIRFLRKIKSALFS